MADKQPAYRQLINGQVGKIKAGLQTGGNAAPAGSSHAASGPLEAVVKKAKPLPRDAAADASQPAVPLKVSLAVISKSRISAKPSNKLLVKILSPLGNSVYNPRTNEWSFDAAHYPAVAVEMKKNKIAFDAIPAGTLALCSKAFPDEPLEQSEGIFGKLMKFQRSAVAFAVNRGGRVLLADDMGLGKTIQALAVAEYYKADFPLLILAPASLLNNWADAVRTFLGYESTIIRQKADFGDRISIISYNLATTTSDIIRLKDYKVVIADECHYLKSTTSKRTKVLLPVLQSARRLVMISGTPAMSRPVELYPVISALDKSAYTNFHVYGMRYCNGRKFNNFYDFRGCSNAGELSLALENAFMIRRTKDLVLGQLPKKFRRQVPIEAKKRSGAAAGLGGRECIGETVPQTIMESFNEAATLKLEPVVSYLETIVEKDVKSLVFAHHAVMLDGIESFCKEKKVAYIRIDGSTPTSKRHTMVEAFQKNNDIRLAILSLTACSTGLTLTAGKAVIFAELYWNPGTMLQAEDRIHRIGQLDSVDIHYLVAQNTVDEFVWPQLLRKLTVLESLGVGKNELKYVKESRADEGPVNTLDGFLNKR
ncbi:SWI/SNF-related matrix-associated actin-dependent regulator of chromatin subfamily A-like protein 1 [Pancytospora philotis]|nr:SWI/SNF-related matrix-associated actin-dependent regulator of chromatin subfamily A-like protein 1 [Pancytospora philotis]